MRNGARELFRNSYANGRFGGIGSLRARLCRWQTSRTLPFGFGSINNVHGIADILFVRNSLDGLRRELHFAFEMRRKFAEELHTGEGFEFITANDRLQSCARFDRRNALAQSRAQ